MVDFDQLRHVSHTTSILEVLDHYNIEYRREGSSRFKAVCPFHSDHTPSLVLYTTPNNEDESFYCYPCHAGGDVFRFIQLMEDSDFRVSWSVLCHIRGIEDDDAVELDELEIASLQLQKEQRKEEVSVSSYDFQISTMYRDFYLQYVDETNEKELSRAIDERLLLLDKILDTNPSAADMRQYFMQELQFVTHLKPYYQSLSEHSQKVN